ncbi:MAG: hypothetical protein A2Y62_13550 [Candidatus Fischerbacteria bacterium RBG_13_37_8]|uniref:NWD1/2-like winged helix-turn-helix domain-containing protein n=1 Tax=Candidatus Fischerbacteria bacterium RBG_13_37_8 TaxID=1817863 RepID=A0A1F5VXJ9_9BACT|nr:MAG: hypothetical protein A2Y62_13550 [Candidatus Fischerbacteria bacterium RBG_13_37_8]
MAEAARRARLMNPDATVIERYIGVTPSSSNIIHLLRDLIIEINKGFSEQSVHYYKHVKEADIPFDYNSLIKVFKESLEHSSAYNRNIYIFLDALDRLRADNSARHLYWLPLSLPEHIRLIVSETIVPQITSSNSDTFDPRADMITALESRVSKNNRLVLESLSQEEGAIVLNCWLEEAGRTLQPSQREAILEVFRKEGRPLWLRAASSEALRLHSWEPSLFFPASINGIIDHLLNRLSHEKEHGSLLVERALSYIASARRGLTEDELIEVLSKDKAVILDIQRRFPKSSSLTKVPIALWVRLYEDTAFYLCEVQFSGDNLFNFYHFNFLEAVKSRYLKSPIKRCARHDHLVKYFAQQNYRLEDTEKEYISCNNFLQATKPVNIRKVDELPWQLIQVAEISGRNDPHSPDWSALVELLTDWQFLEAKTEARQDMIFELVQDFSYALRCMPLKQPFWQMTKLLEIAIRRDINFIARHPTTLFQCMWNSCWWYDCPGAARHYCSVDGELEEEEKPWESSSEKLYLFLEKWRQQKEEKNPNFYWLRSLRPPVFHLNPAQIACLRGHNDGICSIAFSPNDLYIASASSDKTIRIWDAETGQELLCLNGHEDSVNSVAFSHVNYNLASGSNDWTIRIWDSETGDELRCFTSREAQITSIAYSNSGKLIASAYSSGSVQIWDAETEQYRTCLGMHNDAVSCLAFSPDDRQIASGSSDDSLRIWDTNTGIQLSCLQISVYCRGIYGIAFSPDGKLIACGYGDNKIRIWDANKSQEMICLYGHEDVVTSVAFSKDNKFIASGSKDKTARIWDVKNGRSLTCFRGHEGTISSVAFSENGRFIASGSRDRTVRIWDTNINQEQIRLKNHESHIPSISMSPNDECIVSGSWDKTIRIWDANRSCERMCLPHLDDKIHSVAFSPNGQCIAAVTKGKINIFSIESGKQITCLDGRCSHIISVSFSYDSNYIAGACGNKICVWNVYTGEEKLCLYEYKGSVLSVAFSPNSKHIAGGFNDKIVRIWDAHSGRNVAHLSGHEGWIYCIGFSPDNLLFASGAGDNTVRVWDIISKKQLACLEGHERQIYDVAFSQDGKYIASASWDHTIRIWEASEGKCLETIDGKGDIRAILRKQKVRAIVRSLEIVAEIQETRQPTGWYPASFSLILTNKSGDFWVGSERYHLHMICPEGNL